MRFAKNNNFESNKFIVQLGYFLHSFVNLLLQISTNVVQVSTIAITMPTVTILMVLSIVPAKRATQEMEQTAKVIT